MRRCLPFLLLCLVGCTTPPPTRPYTEAELRAQVKADNRNPWPHYGLAKIHLKRMEYEEAVREYGKAINLLPPNKATRPVLELGILHHRMANPEPALRCYEEVLATIPYAAKELYEGNHDFKYAAIGAKVILEAREDGAERVEELRARFIDEFGGTEEQWSQGATWITSLSEPAPELPDAPKPDAPKEQAPE